MNDQSPQQEALDLRSYLRPVWRRKWVVLAIVVLATTATYVISSRQAKTYVASTKLYVQTADPTQNLTSSGGQLPPSIQSVADVAQLVVAQPITSAVGHRIGRPVSATGSVTATPTTGSDFVTITATSHSPDLAARLANTYASVFLTTRKHAVAAEARRDQHAARATLANLPGKSKNLTDLSQRTTVLDQIETFRQIALNPSAGAQQVDTASVPGRASSPRPKRDAIFGGVVGLVLALIVAFVLELLDRRLSRVSTLEQMYGRPVLAVLPHVSDPTPLVIGQRSVVPPEFLEELRSLTVMLRLSGGPRPPRTIMVTSALPREGKSTVTRELALVYASGGQRVLVIDGDLRRPSMQRLFALDADRGLAQALRAEATLYELAVPAIRFPDAAGAASNGHGAAPAGGRGLVDVLVHGEHLANPLALLASARMVALLKEASQLYDVVLLDTPPVLTVADSVPLMREVDSVLLVTRLGQTTRQAADRFTELINRLSTVTFSGVIANDKRGRSDEDGYGSYGRYGYAYQNGVKAAKREQQADTTAS